MRACLLAVALVACGRPSGSTPPVPPPPRDAVVADATLDQDLPRLAARSVLLYQGVVAAFTTAGEDCAIATQQLRDLAITYADVPVANAKVEHEGRGPALKAALRPHDDVLAEAAKTIMQSSTLAACAPDPAFGAAWEALVAPR